MPNFAYTNQTNFRPFSYQEMLAPVLMATQAHQAVEEAYSELDSQANAIGSLANEANDPVTYQRYKAYESTLRTQADALAKNGLTPGSRQSLLDLKGRYAKDITPIQNAITRRRELADEQRKALLQNPTLMFQRDMNSMSHESSLDRFLENPDYDYGERYSGALLTQQVSQAAGNLAKELSNYGNGKRLDDYTKTFLQQHGFTRDQVLDAISNPNRAQSQPVLNAIVEQVMGSSGMTSWADQPTMDKAYNYARQGLWSAIGQTNVSTYEDYDARLAAQDDMQKRLKDYERQQAEQNRLKMYNINPSSLYGREEVAAQNKATKELLEKFKSKGYFNSKGALTNAGMKALQSATERTTWKKGPGSDYYEVPVRSGDWEFKNWALKHGLTQANIDAGNAGNVSINNYPGTPNIDIYRQAVRDKTTRDFLADKVTSTIGADGKIYRVGDLTVSNGKVTMGKGKGMSQDEFKKLVKGSPILYIANSPATNNQIIELTDGSRFIMPVGMLDRLNQENLTGANIKIMQSASPQETAVNLNNANSYLGAILNYNEGTGISTNDGTIIVQ